MRSTTGSTGYSRPGRRRRSPARSSERRVAQTSGSASPWPTDHRGVVSTFIVSCRRYRPVRCSFGPAAIHGLNAGVSWGGRRFRRAHRDVPAGQGASAAGVASQAVGLPALRDGSAIPDDCPGTGRLRRDPRRWRDRRLQVAVLGLSTGDADDRADDQEFVCRFGEPTGVSWKAAPGFRWDWLAIYSPGDSAESPHNAGCNAGCSSNGRYLGLHLHQRPRSTVWRVRCGRSLGNRHVATEARGLRHPPPWSTTATARTAASANGKASNRSRSSQRPKDVRRAVRCRHTHEYQPGVRPSMRPEDPDHRRSFRQRSRRGAVLRASGSDPPRGGRR